MKSLRAAYRKIFMSTETAPLSLDERLTKMVTIIAQLFSLLSSLCIYLRNIWCLMQEQNQELYSVPAVGAMLQSIRDSFAEGRRGICKFRQWLDSWVSQLRDLA